MDMLGGSPQPDRLPDGGSLHPFGAFSKWLWLCSAATANSIMVQAAIGGLVGKTRKGIIFRVPMPVRNLSAAPLSTWPRSRHPISKAGASPREALPAVLELGQAQAGSVPHSDVVRTRKARYLKRERVWDAELGRKPHACGSPNISGGDDQRRRTRVAGATGAFAAGAPRSRRRDLRPAAFAGLRSVAGPAFEKTQARPARSNFLHRGPAYPRYHCLIRLRRSLRRDTRFADHLGPALGLFPLELCHVLRAAADGGDLQRTEALLGSALVGGFVDGAVELRDDGRRRLGRRADRVPGIRHEARHADLDQRREVRQDIQPMIGGDRNDSCLAALV